MAAFFTAGIATEPAQAAALAPGRFILERDEATSISGYTGVIGSTFTLNIDALPLNIVSTEGVFSGALAGTPNVPVLPLTITSPGNFSFPSGTNVLTGLTLDGNPIFFDVNGGTLTGAVFSPAFYTFIGEITGVIRDSSQTALANGALVSFEIGNGPATNRTTLTITTTPIPTPALLPGLIGFGVAAVRKRKALATQEAEA
jgi:hypothetical protein